MGIPAPFASEKALHVFGPTIILSCLSGMPIWGYLIMVPGVFRHWVHCVSKLLGLKSRTFNYQWQ
jgi:hypothetical protein